MTRPLRYLSVCSGIEAATQAWHPLGWQPVAFSEIEPFPCAVLAHHYPQVPNWGDMTKFQEWPDADVDVLCGGTPCQSYSIAGLRKGLDDPRGNLMLTFGGIAARYRSYWLVWENVPGVLSSAGGRDFASLLGLLSGRAITPPAGGWSNSGIVPGIADAYGIAWRVLDAQHVRTRRFPFAVPQRRRRVFVIGYLGDWRRAAAVLFDRESLSRHPAPRRQSGQNVAPTISARTSGGGGLGTDFDLDGGLIAAPVVSNAGEIAFALTANSQGSGDAEGETLLAVAHALRGEGFDASEDGTGRGTPLIPVSFPLTAGMAKGASRMPQEQGALGPVQLFRTAGDGAAYHEGNIAAPLTTGTDPSAQVVVIQERAVSENPDAGPDGAGLSCAGAAYTLEARSKVQAVAFAENQQGDIRLSDVSTALSTGGGKPGQGYTAVAFDLRGRDGGAMPEGPLDTANIRAASGGSSRSYVAEPWAVRRLIPVECERLQGFTDNFTRIPGASKSGWRDVDETEDLDELRELGLPVRMVGNRWRVKDPDGPRYKAIGNSWAVNCAEWIGERIAEVDAW